MAPLADDSREERKLTWEKQESSEPVSQSVLTSRNELKKKVGGYGKQGGKMQMEVLFFFLYPI